MHVVPLVGGDVAALVPLAERSPEGLISLADLAAEGCRRVGYAAGGETIRKGSQELKKKCPVLVSWLGHKNGPGGGVGFEMRVRVWC